MEQIQLDSLNEEKQHYLETIEGYFKDRDRRFGYIRVPTGWGKTFLAKHLMKQDYEQGKLILFLVSRNNQLLKQTFYLDGSKPLFGNSLLLFSEFGKMNMPDLEARLTMRTGGLVVFASLQTLLSVGHEGVRDLLIANADLVVVDEIHNFIGNRGNDFISRVNENKKTRILGMTATPFQGVLGHLKFVDDIAEDIGEIFNKTLPQCIIDNQLSELHYSIIRSNQSIVSLFDFKKGLSELNNDELSLDCGTQEKIGLTIQRTKLAKHVYDKEISDEDSKTLIFCAPVRNVVQGLEDHERNVPAFHARLCAAIFNGEVSDRIDKSFAFKNYSDGGQLKKTVYLSSDLSQTERDHIVRAFKTAGKPPYILCTVGMLIEGFDFPDLQNILLLRPTLSMRLFEQQIGRVTRLPKESAKKRGNIFEIVDQVDSLYDRFENEVFLGNNIERVQLLQPENRIEELFDDGSDFQAVRAGKINISDIRYGGEIGEFQKNSVEIPPVSLRAKHLHKLLSMVNEMTSGKLTRERLKLMQMALGFKVHNLDSATEIKKILARLEQLQNEALTDQRLSSNCRTSKPEVFKEVRYLLLLSVLTYLKYSCMNMVIEEKCEILHSLGFDGNHEKIEEYRKQCYKNCQGIEYNEKVLNGLAGDIKMLSGWYHSSFISHARVRYMMMQNIYWASCFVEDNPTIRELFSSREWNYVARGISIKAH